MLFFFINVSRRVTSAAFPQKRFSLNNNRPTIWQPNSFYISGMREVFFMSTEELCNTFMNHGTSKDLEQSLNVVTCCFSGLCKYVECKYELWSAWSTSCGKGQRFRHRQTIQKSDERENCNGLPTSCPTSPNIEIRNKKCEH